LPPGSIGEKGEHPEPLLQLMLPLVPLLPLYVTLPPCTLLHRATMAGEHHWRGLARHRTSTTTLAEHPHLHAHENMASIGLVPTLARHRAARISPVSRHHRHGPSSSTLSPPTGTG
jgi:hypothetical protein